MIKKMLVLLLSLLLLSSNSIAESSYFSIGDYNDDVISLHQKLNELGYFSLRSESPYSSQTVDALESLQKDYGLEVTGSVRKDELNEILNLHPIINTNLLTGYFQKLNDSKYLSAEDELDGQAILHLKYSDGEKEYVNLINWSEIIEPEGDMDYTLSFMAKGSGTIQSFFYPKTVISGYSNIGGQTKSGDGNIETPLNDEWTYYTITWHTRKDVEGLKNVLPARVFKGTEVWISKIKFERGSRATEWVLPEE